MDGDRGGFTSDGTAKRFPVVFFVTTVSLAFYLLFLPASVYWLDSPEFMTAAAKLSLPHPPGHPVAVLLMKFFTLLPVGDVAFRANLFGAFFGAIAAGLVAGIAWIVSSGVVRRFAPGLEWPATLLALASGFLFAGCRSMVIQSMAAEVYTLNAALLLGALYLVMSGPAGDARRGVAAGVLFGLALANHHFLALLCAPALAAAFWTGRRSLKQLARIIAAGIATALACYMFVAVRGAGDAWPTWARISGAGDFLWYVSASIFSQSVGGFEPSGGGPLQNLGLAFVLIGSSLGMLSPVLALGGAWLAARSGGARHVVVLVLLASGSIASKVMMGLLDPSNPDDHGYFLLAIAALAILAPVMLALPVALSRASRLGWLVTAVTVALVVLIPAWPLRGGIEVGSQRGRFDHTNRVADLAWRDIPNGAAAFVSHYPVYFVLQYGQEVEDARPDVTLVQESLYFKALGGKWYADEMARRHPALAGLMSDFRASGRLSWPRLRSLAAVRPVVLEASPDFDAVMEDIAFSGWFFRFGQQQGTTAQVAVDQSASVVRGLGAAAGVNIETRRVAVRNLVSSADWLARSGDRAAAAELLRTALVFNPRDRAVRARLSSVSGDGI